jgi:hypothetical protein
MKARLFTSLGGLRLPMILLCTALGTAQAQDADPPGRVARLSDAEGSVSLQPAGVQEWTAATLNRPLTTGDKLWSDQNSRAELDIGDAAVRLGSATGFAFLNLDDTATQMQLTAGTLIVRLRDMQGGQNYEVDTPNLALSLQQPGEYRVEVNDAGNTTIVSVSQGSAQAASGGQTVAITAQQRVTFSGTGTLAFQSAILGAPDDLDNWSAQRERELQDSASGEYVAEDIPGTQDLDDNGRWQDTIEYGYVWTPTAVVVGWVPYRFGHWLWVTPWGWTWVDDARWGYAPFHYGRWVQWNNAWCWVPGPRHVHPVYAPALVGWVGAAPMGAPAVFNSHIGWFPLGPREVYVPGPHVSQTYVRNVNVTNTTVVSNTYITNVYERNITPTHYVNNRPAAVTSIPQNIFVSGQQVGRHAVQLPPAVLAGAVVAAAAPAIAPIRQSIVTPAGGRGVPHPPAALLQRTVVARTPPPRSPAPLERQLAAIQANGGYPLSRAEITQLQPTTPAASVRVVKVTGPVVSAASRPHASASGRAGNAAQSHIAAPNAPDLAERMRALQQSTLVPQGPHADTARMPAAGAGAGLPTYAPPARPAETPATPVWRADRPSSAEQHVPVVQQRAFTPDDPTHATGHPPALPVYRPPTGADTSGSAQESVNGEERRHASAPAAPPASVPRAPAPSPAPAAQPAPQAVHPAVPPPPPAHPQTSSEPRDSAPHGDRDSRERATR